MNIHPKICKSSAEWGDFRITGSLPKVPLEADCFVGLVVLDRVETRMLCFIFPMSRFVEPSFSWASLDRPVTGSSYSIHFRYMLLAFRNLPHNCYVAWETFDG